MCPDISCLPSSSRSQNSITNMESSNFTATVHARHSGESEEPIVDDNGAIEMRMYNQVVKDMSGASTNMSTVDGDGCKSADRRDMQRMGKQQQFQRVFRQFSLLSFTCICMSTWEFLLLDNETILEDGGRAGLFWSYVWALVGYGAICASLAEMASMSVSNQLCGLVLMRLPVYQSAVDNSPGLQNLRLEAVNASSATW